MIDQTFASLLLFSWKFFLFFSFHASQIRKLGRNSQIWLGRGL